MQSAEPAVLSDDDDAEKQLMPQERMDRSTTIQYVSEDEKDVLIPCSLLGIGCCFIPFLLPCFACLNVRRYKQHQQKRQLTHNENFVYNLSYITMVICIIGLLALAILVGISWLEGDDLIFITTN